MAVMSYFQYYCINRLFYVDVKYILLKSVGFRLDTNQVDQVKYPRHEAASQQCSKCQLFSVKPGEPFGACSFYGGRQVPLGGWCRNFKVRKAAA